MHEYLTAEISPSAVAANLALLRGRLAPGAKLCAVVKANCYGLGVELLLPTIARGADWLAVAAPVEAARVRELGYGGPLLVFFSCRGYTGRQRQEAIEELIRRRVTLTAASPDDIGPIAEASRALGTTADVHLKIDSGMGRSGVAPHRAADVAEAIRASDGLRLTGVYTHFATADDADPSYMREQLRQFRSAAEALPGRDELILHAANSAATISAPDSHLDMARAGLAVYGYQPAEPWRGRLQQGPVGPAHLSQGQPARTGLAPAASSSAASAEEEEETHGRDARDTHGQDAHATDGGPLPLRPALRLWGRLLATKPLPAGASVGYGRTCTLRRASTVGLVPVGYADGYFRCLSNGSTMHVGGRDVPVLGRLSMDQTVIDLTDVPGAKAGDAVEIISPDPSAPHSVENLARLAGTIPYEITCRLGPRARRVAV